MRVGGPRKDAGPPTIHNSPAAFRLRRARVQGDKTIQPREEKWIMFDVWEAGDPGTRLARAGTLDAALAELDDECRRRHDQVAANDEGAGEIRYQFEVRDQDGTALAWLTYSPDPAHPYESVIVDKMLRDAP